MAKPVHNDVAYYACDCGGKMTSSVKPILRHIHQIYNLDQPASLVTDNKFGKKELRLLKRRLKGKTFECEDCNRMGTPYPVLPEEECLLLAQDLFSR